VSDDLVIQYLRARARVDPEPGLVGRIMAAVDAAPDVRSPFMAFVPAIAIAAAVAVVIALALILGQGPNIGPNPSESAEATPSPAAIEELQGAIESGIEVLRGAPGVEGIGTSSILDELAAATWFSWRPNGDQVAISRSDVDVSQTGWWMESGGEPPARGVNVTTTIQVLAGDEYFRAVDGPWEVRARQDAPSVLTIATGLLDGERLAVEGFIGNADGEATVTRHADGATTWTLTAPYRDGTLRSEWQVAPDGGLGSWSSELIDVTPTPEDAPFATFQEVTFERLSEAPPIEAPDPESPPDANALGLPPDFPLGAGSSVAVHHVA
jgi:hypothetical protein